MSTVCLLLIEDDGADEAIISRMLLRAHLGRFAVTRAATLSDAERCWQDARFDLVLLDLSLPDASAAQMFSWISRMADVAPIIVLTGTDDADLALGAIKARAQDYLVKWDFTPRLLARAIRYAIERREIEQELRRAKDAAEAANRAKSAFLANMSHEIRTPLGAVLGMVDVLADSRLDEEQRRQLELLRQAGEHLHALLDDVLDLSKIEAGVLDIEEVELRPAEVVTTAVSTFAHRAEEKDLALGCSIDDDVPEALLGDPHRVRQVLLNLVGNAVKFTNSGSVAVRAYMQPGRDGAARLCLSVQDTGPGIPSNAVEAIFAPFAQADPSITRRHGGTGLGLTIARKLTELMGGELSVRSQVGVGSRFLATVPARPAPARAGTLARGAPRPALERPLRLLLVDDAEENRTIVESFLRGGAHELLCATNGAEGVERFTRFAPDLVLLDVHMPVLDGYQAAAAMRAWEAAQGLSPTPIVALTADALKESLDRALAAGCTARLCKPLRKRTFLEAIAQHAQVRAAERPSPTGDAVWDGDLLALLPGYVRKRLRDVTAMQALLARSDFASIQTLGHNMKGSGGSYGLAPLSELGALVETAASAGDATALARHIEGLSAYLGGIERHLRLGAS